MQRRFKSEIVTANDCCINTDVCRLCMLLGYVTSAAKAKAIQTAPILCCIVSS